MVRLYRADKRFKKAELATKHVVIFGAGSVGGYCAQAIAHLVGKLTIIDYEALSITNVERHRAGKAHIGKFKVVALQQILAEHYGLDPESIIPIHENALEVLPRLEGVDLAIEATCNPDLRYDLNLWAQELEVPVVYPGVYAGGSGWQIATLPNPREVCFMCLELSATKPTRSRQELHDYSDEPIIAKEASQLHAASGLVSAVMAVAASTVEQAIDILQGDSMEPVLLRTTYRPRDFMLLPDADAVKRADLAIKLLKPLGIELFELVENQEGFTLRQKPGSIPHIIQQASGCPFHQAPEQGVEGG